MVILGQKRRIVGVGVGRRVGEDGRGGRGMGRVREGEQTRGRLADALLKLAGEKDLTHIRVGELAAAAGVNRQTFYYHFADIYDLAEWAYDREITRIFGVDSLAATFEEVDAYTHAVEILRALRGSSPGLRNLLFFFDRRAPKGHFYELIRRNAELYHVPAKLNEAGVATERAELYEDLWATAVTALAMGWVRGEVPLSAEEFVRLIGNATHGIASGLLAGERKQLGAI